MFASWHDLVHSEWVDSFLPGAICIQSASARKNSDMFLHAVRLIMEHTFLCLIKINRW